MTNDSPAALPDIAAFTRDELEQLRAEIVAEQQRLGRLDAAPGEVQYAVRTFLLDGGDIAAIQHAVAQGVADAEAALAAGSQPGGTA